MTRIIVIANQKGGVGKTTSAVNLATAFCANEKNVLLLDMDPQTNATSSIGYSIPHNSGVQSIYDLAVHYFSNNAFPVVKSGVTEIDLLQIIPGSPDAAALESEITDLPGSRTFIREMLQNATFVNPVNGEEVSALEIYDWIIIDTPPGIGLLTLNAIAAANLLIIPVQAEYLALEGLSQIIRTAEIVKTNFNPDLDQVRVLITMYDQRLRLSRAVKDELSTNIPSISTALDLGLYESLIPRNIRLAEAPSFGKPIFLVAPESSGATAYIELSKEVENGQKAGIRSRSELALSKSAETGTNISVSHAESGPAVELNPGRNSASTPEPIFSGSS